MSANYTLLINYIMDVKNRGYAEFQDIINIEYLTHIKFDKVVEFVNQFDFIDSVKQLKDTVELINQTQYF